MAFSTCLCILDLPEEQDSHFLHPLSRAPPVTVTATSAGGPDVLVGAVRRRVGQGAEPGREGAVLREGRQRRAQAERAARRRRGAQAHLEGRPRQGARRAATPSARPSAPRRARARARRRRRALTCARVARARSQFPPSNPDAQAFDQHAIDAAGLRVLTPSKRARAGSGQWTGGGLPKAAPGRSVSAASAEPRIVEGASESDEEEEGLFMSVWRCC